MMNKTNLRAIAASITFLMTLTGCNRFLPLSQKQIHNQRGDFQENEQNADANEELSDKQRQAEREKYVNDSLGGLKLSGLKIVSPTDMDAILSTILDSPTALYEENLPDTRRDRGVFENQLKEITTEDEYFEVISQVNEQIADQILSSKMMQGLLESANCLPAPADTIDCIVLAMSTLEDKLFRGESIDNDINIDQFARNLSELTELTITSQIKIAFELVLLHPLTLHKLYLIANESPKVNAIRKLNILSGLLWGLPPTGDMIKNVTMEDFTGEALDGLLNEFMSNKKFENNLSNMISQWFDYSELRTSQTELHQALYEETTEFIKHQLVDQNKSFLSLFDADQRVISNDIIAHYGLSGMKGNDDGSLSVVDAPGGHSILEHGSVLSVSLNSGTSPTTRGKFIIENILCSVIPDPPDNIDVDDFNPDIASDCHEDKIRVLSESPDCQGCHQLMDGIGLGLAGLGPLGELNFMEGDQCEPTGEGLYDKTEAFTGAMELSQVMLNQDKLSDCVSTRFFEYGLHAELTTEEKKQAVDATASSLDIKSGNFKDFMKIITKVIVNGQ